MRTKAQGAVEKKEIESHEWTCQAMAPRFTMPACRVGSVLAAGGMSASGSSQSPAGKKQVERNHKEMAAVLQGRRHYSSNVHVPQRLVLQRLYAPVLMRLGSLKVFESVQVRARVVLGTWAVAGRGTEVLNSCRGLGGPVGLDRGFWLCRKRQQHRRGRLHLPASINFNRQRLARQRDSISF